MEEKKAAHFGDGKGVRLVPLPRPSFDVERQLKKKGEQYTADATHSIWGTVPTRAGSFILRRLYCSSSSIPAVSISIYLISSSASFFPDFLGFFFSISSLLSGDSLLFAAANIRPCTARRWHNKGKGGSSVHIWGSIIHFYPRFWGCRLPLQRSPIFCCPFLLLTDWNSMRDAAHMTRLGCRSGLGLDLSHKSPNINPHSSHCCCCYYVLRKPALAWFIQIYDDWLSLFFSLLSLRGYDGGGTRFLPPVR